MKNLINPSLLLFALHIFAFGVFAQADRTAELVAQTGHTNFVTAIAFSPDGRFLATGGKDNTVKIWDAAAGQELKSITIGTVFLRSVAFSPDGKRFAAVSDDNLKLWDVETGRVVKILSTEAKWMDGLTFSPDGTTLAAADRNASVKIWDIGSGAVAAREPKILAGHKSFIATLAFSPDGKTLASGGGDAFVKLWDVAGGRERKTINTESSRENYISALAFSANGEVLASGGKDEILNVWNAASGERLKSVRAAQGQIHQAAFSPDGRTFATAGEDKTIKLWDAVSWRLLKIISGHSDAVTSLGFSPDGKTLAAGSAGVVKIFDAASGGETKELAGQVTYSVSVALSPDGKTLLLGADDGTVKLLDTAGGARSMKVLGGHVGKVVTVAYTPDGKTLVSQSVEPSKYTSGKEEGDEALLALQRLASKGTIKLWDAASMRELRQITAAGGFETFAALEKLIPGFTQVDKKELKTPDGRLKIKLGANGKVDLLEAATGKLAASVVVFGATDWAIVTPEGLFDATPGARRLMHYIVGLEPVALEQMKDVYYVPGLLQKVFKGEALPRVELFSRRDLFPAVEFSPLAAGQKNLTVKLENRGGGIGQVQILVNGKEFIKDARPAGFDRNAKNAALVVDLKNAPLVDGAQNKIEVVAANAAGSLSTRGTERGTKIVNVGGSKNKADVNIYAIVGGISDYTGDGLKLNFAAKDAEDFARALDLGATKMLGDKSKVHIRLLTSNGEKANVKFNAADARISKATKADFQAAFNDFKNATPDDVFIVYMAGHGVSLNVNQNQVQAGGDTYLYLTQEATTTDMSAENARRAMAVSSDELKDLMKTNRALKQVLILDTCASGQAAQSFVQRRDLPSDQIKAIERLKDNTGFYVLMGSAADAVSYEASQYGQGLLTYSLLQGMKGARLRENQFADVESLFGYAVERVPQMAKNIGGIQQPRIITPDQSRSFDIGKFTAEEQKQIALSNPKPIVLRPNLRNGALRFDNLKLSAITSAQLREISYVKSRGAAQSPIVFVEADEMTDAVLPVGDYTIEGDTLKISVILVKNNQPIGKEIVVTGKTNEPEKVIKQLVEAIMKLLS